MIIHSIHDLTDQVLVNLLKTGLDTINDSKYIKNYHPDFSDQPGNLFYILSQGRYQKGRGKYFIIEEDGKYICSAGWNEYELDPTVVLVLTRMYIVPEHRARYHIGNHILPKAIQEASNYKKIWITCNEHNKAIYNWFLRASTGKRPALYNNWPEIYKRFTPVGMKTVYYTDQYVVEYQQ